LFKQAWFAFVLCDGIAVFHFVQNVFPKPRDCRLISLRRLPRWAPYPKSSKQTLRVHLAFLTLIRSIKQACFASSH